MVSAISLYFDESVEVVVADQIRQRGIDAVNVRDLGLLGDTDRNHLKRASEMGRVLCTYDTDFLQLAAEGIEHSGIVFGWANRTTIGNCSAEFIRLKICKIMLSICPKENSTASVSTRCPAFAAQ